MGVAVSGGQGVQLNYLSFDLLHLFPQHSLVEVVVVTKTNLLDPVELTTLFKIIQCSITLQHLITINTDKINEEYTRYIYPNRS